MKKLIFSFLCCLVIFSIVAPLVIADPLSAVSPWYCTLRGEDKGAFKVSFNPDRSLSGVGGTKTRGVISIGETYEFYFETNKFSGTYHITGDFGNDAGSFEGKINNKGNKFSCEFFSDSGNKYRVRGLTRPSNTMIDQSYYWTIKGADEGYFIVEPGQSGIDDIFHLSGSGETKKLGSGDIEIFGYADGKKKIYGSWFADGDQGSNYGTFKGKGKKLRIKGKAKDPSGKVFRIRATDLRYFADEFDYPTEDYYGWNWLWYRPSGPGCDWVYHPGEDMGGDLSTPIYAVGNGVVVFAGYQGRYTGNIVVIKHTALPNTKFRLPGGGRARTVWSAYYHMSKIDGKNVKRNRAIQRGIRVGFMGGFPLGSGENVHLHFEVRKRNIWNGSAYNAPPEKSVCFKSLEWILDKFVCPTKFIELNRPVSVSTLR